MSARLLEIFEKLKYSDADSSLRHVYTILNFYKGVHRELNYENQRVTDKEGKLVNLREVIEELSEDLGGTLKLTQKETARKVLHRYYKNVKTKETSL